MRITWLAVTFCLLAGSCKLMKKKEAGDKNTSHMNQGFTTVDWARQANIYEVNLRQYTQAGTINAFATELSRLKDMGVQTLWFMPITPIAEKNRKGSLGSYYACSDYVSVSPEFGTLEDFTALVKQAHSMGMKVILDWVANHTGWDHTWTKTHPEYYLKDSATHDFKTASGMDDIIELDYRNPALRKAMREAMKFWVTTCDIDGFRCDLAAWVELDFWKEARAELDKIKPLFWLGEFDELENPDYGGAFDCSYSWTWMHRTEDFYKKHEPLDSLLALLKDYDNLGDHTMRAWFTSNHDENTWNGTEYEKYGDMAGALAVFSATWNGIPLVYSGQELPYHKRLAFFEKDTIAWKGTYEKEEFYKKLLHLKTGNPALRAGDKDARTYLLRTSQPANILAYIRKKDNHEVLVILNMGPGNMLHFDLTDSMVDGKWNDLFSGLEYDFSTGKAMELPGWGYRVYER